MLHESGRVSSPDEGTTMVAKVIKNGAAKKKLMAMLQAQGVAKHNVKAMLKHKRHEAGLSAVLPIANYFTHLPTEETGEPTRRHADTIGGAWFVFRNCCHVLLSPFFVSSQDVIDQTKIVKRTVLRCILFVASIGRLVHV